MPDDEIQYGEQARRLNEDELSEFEPASIRFQKQK